MTAWFIHATGLAVSHKVSYMYYPPQRRAQSVESIMTTRRDFLQRAALASAASFALPASAGATPRSLRGDRDVAVLPPPQWPWRMQQYAPRKPHDRSRECRTCTHFKGERTGARTRG